MFVSCMITILLITYAEKLKRGIGCGMLADVLTGVLYTSDPEFFPREVSSWPNGPNSLHIEWILRESSYSSALTTFGFRFSHFEVAWIENSTSPTPNTMSVPLHDRRYINYSYMHGICHACECTDNGWLFA